MRVIVTAVIVVAAMAIDLQPEPARTAHRTVPWCVIRNTGIATWQCYPSHALCRRFGEVPNTGFSCVEYPVWSGRG